MITGRPPSMSTEIRTLSSYPYSAIVHLTVTFADGTRVAGTGALVGRNDILTATHVLYDPTRGGWASEIGIAVGVDYNSTTGRYESRSLVDLQNFTWKVQGWPAQTFADGDNSTLTWSESRYDVALIGLDQAIGDQVGWFGLAPGYDSPQWAYQIGYPSNSSGMMLSQAWIEPSRFYSVYNAYASSGSDIMGPGSSGGPLFVYENGSPYIIGVKSSGSATASTWADIGFLYQPLLAYIADNDTLLPDYRPAQGNNDWLASTPVSHIETIGTRKADILRGSAAADKLIGLQGRDTLIGGAGDDILDGGAGNDILHGGSGNDLLIGGAGRDLYLWEHADLQPGERDQLIDDKGSRLQFDSDLLAQLLLGGSTLASLTRKQFIGSHIDTANSLAWKDGSLLVDLDGDGHFDAARDFSIEIVGNASRILFDARSDLLILS